MINVTPEALKIIRDAVGPNPEPVRIFAAPG